MSLFLLGLVTMGCFAAGLFFLRFWRETRDPLFLAFAVSFFIEAVNRTALAATGRPNEGAPFFYLVRLASYLLILVAVAAKNSAVRDAAGGPPAAASREATPRGEKPAEG